MDVDIRHLIDSMIIDECALDVRWGRKFKRHVDVE